MNKSVTVLIWFFCAHLFYLLGYLWELRGCDGGGNDSSLWLGAIAALLYFFHSHWEHISYYYNGSNVTQQLSVVGPLMCCNSAVDDATFIKTSSRQLKVHPVSYFSQQFILKWTRWVTRWLNIDFLFGSIVLANPSNVNMELRDIARPHMQY